MCFFNHFMSHLHQIKYNKALTFLRTLKADVKYHKQTDFFLLFCLNINNNLHFNRKYPVNIVT